MDDLEEFCPSSKDNWRNWLEANHQEKDAVWLIFYKKKSAKHNLNWSDSVDEALCYGWIDSVKKSIDDEKFKQYFSKRKPNSVWSKINKDKIEYLTSQGRMKKAGLQTIEVAQENGSWSILDDVEALILPADLELAFSNNEGALEFYDGLSKSLKKILLSWVALAKRAETRQNRIEVIADNAGNGVLPKQFR